MYVLERLAGGSVRHLLTAPDHESVRHLLQMILRARAHSSDQIETEHLRAAAYRLSTEAPSDSLLTLDGEYFHIRHDPEQLPLEAKPSKKALRKIARSVPPILPVADANTSVQDAVKAARTESEPEPGWIQTAIEEPVQINGERFEI